MLLAFLGSSEPTVSYKYMLAINLLLLSERRENLKEMFAIVGTNVVVLSINEDMITKFYKMALS